MPQADVHAGRAAGKLVMEDVHACRPSYPGVPTLIKRIMLGRARAAVWTLPAAKEASLTDR
jgi:hypothetical protein